MAYVSDVILPHFAFPFRMITQPDGSLAADVNEQDSLDDILGCVQAVAVCPQGAWDDQPSFGIPNQVFSQAPVQTDGTVQALGRWEPRAVIAAQEAPDRLSAAIRDVTITVGTLEQDQ